MQVEYAMQNLSMFIKNAGIVFKATKVERRPDSLMNGLASHYRCRLSRDGHTYVTYYSCGSAAAAPTVEDLLDSLASDCNAIEGVDVDEFVHEFGYKASEGIAVYNGCKRAARKMRQLLGDDLYDTLLYHTERL